MGRLEAAVTIYVTVYDEEALIKAAREHYGNEVEAQELIIGASSALIELLDPGISPPGCEIQECAVGIRDTEE